MGVQDLPAGAAGSHSGPSPTKKRRTAPPRAARGGEKNFVDLTTDEELPTNVTSFATTIAAAKEEDEELDHGKPQKKNKEPSKNRGADGEKRLRKYRVKAPGTFLQKLERATSQRMYVIDRTRSTSPEGIPSESVQLAGSTGNVYDIDISSVPSCTCPDNRKGNQCKHIVYVLHNVLKAPPDLEYQLAFLTSELKEIFDRAPLQTAQIEATEGGKGEEGGENIEEKTLSGSLRKSIKDEDCIICCLAFEPDDEEDIVWCKAACGNNVHRECFERWAQTKGDSEVTCVFCRTRWVGNDDSLSRIKDAKLKGSVSSEGYFNVGAALGMSSFRDFSSYHPFWVRQQKKEGRNI